MRLVFAVIVGLILGGCHQREISKAEEAVTEYLPDPEATKFRRMRYTEWKDSGFVCGEYNAVDDAGRRQGYVEFIYDVDAGLLLSEGWTSIVSAGRPKDGVLLEQRVQDFEVAEIAQDICGKRGES